MKRDVPKTWPLQQFQFARLEMELIISSCHDVMESSMMDLDIGWLADNQRCGKSYCFQCISKRSPPAEPLTTHAARQAFNQVTMNVQNVLQKYLEGSQRRNISEQKGNNSRSANICR